MSSEINWPVSAGRGTSPLNDAFGGQPSTSRFVPTRRFTDQAPGLFLVRRAEAIWMCAGFPHRGESRSRACRFARPALSVYLLSLGRISPGFVVPSGFLIRSTLCCSQPHRIASR